MCEIGKIFLAFDELQLLFSEVLQDGELNRSEFFELFWLVGGLRTFSRTAFCASGEDSWITPRAKSTLDAAFSWMVLSVCSASAVP